LLVTVTFPSIHPVATGAKFTLKVTLCPAATTAGRFNPDTLNPEQLAVTAEIVMPVCPLFVKATDWVSDCVIATEPNLRFAGELLNCCVVPRACTRGTAAQNRRTVMESRRIEKEILQDWGSLMRKV